MYVGRGATLDREAFTLIELLAVIVILAIIALIATPIILNIINDSKDSANKRSIELYGKAIENAAADYMLLNNGVAPTWKDISDDIRKYYSGNEVVCNNTTINPDGTVYLSECSVGGVSVDYTYGKQEEVASAICTLVEGTAQAIGSKYTCALDENRTFYVLESNESLDTITLLMDRNYTDEQVPTAMTWCDQSGPKPNDNACNHDGLDPYIEKIQTKFGNKVTVGIPSKEQIEGAYTGDMPQWINDYLNSSPNSVSGIFAYWTSTGSSSDSSKAWFVDYEGLTTDYTLALVSSDGFGGMGFSLRPVITVLKSDLS